MAIWDYTGYTSAFYCTGSSTGVEIWLNGSTAGVIYRLYRNGTTVVYTRTGTGNPVQLGVQNISGSYTCRASIAGQPSGWTYTNIDIYWNSVPSVRNITGGGTRYDDDPGFAIGLDNSGPNYVNYNLYRNSILTGQTTGTQSAISFGVYYDSGTYTSRAYVTNSSTTFKSVDNFTVVTSRTYQCWTNMSGSSIIIVYSAPAVITPPTTTIGSQSSFAYTTINVPVTYAIQNGSAINQFKIVLTYDYIKLRYVDFIPNMTGLTINQSRGNIQIEWSSVYPDYTQTKEIGNIQFIYNIGDADLVVSGETYYKFYNRQDIYSLNVNGHVSLFDGIAGVLSASKTTQGVGVVLYASAGTYYDIYFDDIFYQSVTIDEEYKQIYSSTAKKISIKGFLNKLTRIDMSNNDFEVFNFSFTELYRLERLDLEGNRLRNFTIPQFANVYNFKNNHLTRELAYQLIKKCYECGVYNAILDLRDNGYTDTTYVYYQSLLLKGWTILI